MISLSINFRVLLLAVLPTTAVSIIFFSYFVNKQIDDIEANIVDKGKSLASHLASASEYGIFSGNMSILSPLIESAVTKNNIISITVTNSQGTPLIQRSKSDTPEISTLKDKYNRVFSQPVIQNTIDINDFEVTDNHIPPVIGWVIVEVSDEIAVKNKQEAILQTLLITIIILISSIILATRISRHITEPISSLTNVVNEIENGNLDVSIDMHSTGALLTLEKGIRNMLQSIKSSHGEAQNKINKATKELRNSLGLLEQQNSELTITRQQALSASQAKSAFLANISHEIRTPMNGILGFVKLLKGSDPTQEQTDYLYTIEQSADNLLRIINDVLDLSKIEAGKLSINNVHFNLEECIEDVLALVTPSAHEKEIEIAALYYDDTPKYLFGAADRIRQILINLIGNAIKFSDTGTIMVRTMLESRENEALKIKITITDQGPGISEKDQKNLFSSFTQIDESDTRQYGGAGLGLAISKSLAEAMHGSIGVDSQQKTGSTFWFTFECQQKDSAELFDKDINLPYQNKSVRLYDANELTRLSLSHAFKHQGFHITECFDLEDLCLIKENFQIPDICILSLNHQEATSTVVEKFLKTNRNQTGAIILAIASSSNPLTLSSLCSWGANACLSKPFRYIDFEKKLATIFHNQNNIPAQQKNSVEDGPESLTQLDGLNILIAEDNEINSKLVETVLLRSRAIPHVVDNGEKAVSAFKENNFDIILMDIHMPKMNGVDAAREIRNAENPAARIPILGLTAASKSKDEALFRNTDFNEILEKPIAVDELLHEISYWTHAHTFPKATVKSNNKLGIDKGLSTTLNEMLLLELPGVKEKLEAAYESSDYRYLRGEVHRLLGGMAYCDFTELQYLTSKYQTSLKADSDTVKNDFKKMITEIERLISI